MTQKQQRTDTHKTTMTEREMIEAAAAAAPVESSTTTQKAMNIMEASVIQRKAVAEAFEAQKKAITSAVEEQRTIAMQQIAATQKKYAVTEAQKKQLEAREATKKLGQLTREALGEEPGKEKTDSPTGPEEVIASSTDAGHVEPSTESEPAPPSNHVAPSTTSAQPSVSTGAAGTSAAPPGVAAEAISAASTPAPNTPTPPIAGFSELPSDASVANELVLTIRSIISEEIDKQLKTLLAVVTAGENAETPDA